MSNIWVILSFGIESLGKITVVIQFKVLSENSLGEPEKNQTQVKNKGRMLNTLENYHIYKEIAAGNQINAKQTSKSNKIFETVLKHDPKSDNTAPGRRTPQ